MWSFELHGGMCVRVCIEARSMSCCQCDTNTCAINCRVSALRVVRVSGLLVCNTHHCCSAQAGCPSKVCAVEDLSGRRSLSVARSAVVRLLGHEARVNQTGSPRTRIAANGRWSKVEEPSRGAKSRNRYPSRLSRCARCRQDTAQRRQCRRQGPADQTNGAGCR